MIFDIGRVIVRMNVNRGLAALSANTDLSGEQIWSAVQADPNWRDWQEGRIEPRAWHERLDRRLGFDLTFEQFCMAWNSVIEPEPILSERFFAQLASRYRLALLSNTDPIHVAHLEANFDFPRHFASRVYSCTAGASKPDPVIYGRAICETGVPPERILYVDDVPSYVEAGRRVGLQAILFESAEELFRAFRQRSILREQSC